jgi:hypothetical protein
MATEDAVAVVRRLEREIEGGERRLVYLMQGMGSKWGCKGGAVMVEEVRSI